MLKINNGSTSFNNGDCPIASFELTGFSPNSIINIISHEDEVYENTLDFHIVEKLSKISTNLYEINHYAFKNSSSSLVDFFVTDKILKGLDQEYPLFYQYELLFNAVGSQTDLVIKNVYKNNEVIISQKEYEIQYSYDLLTGGNSRYSSTTWGNLDTTTSIHRVRLLFPLSFMDSNLYFTVEYYKSVYGSSKYQKELVELQPIYNENDFTVDTNGLNLTGGTRLDNTVPFIYLLKNPLSRIKPLDIISVKDQVHNQSYNPDKMASWQLRLSTGTVVIPSGYSHDEICYNLTNNYASGCVPLTNVKGEVLNSNIIKVNEVPIYINESKYSYPLYQIDKYDINDDMSVENSGNLSIYVNGVNRNDINITSIDRKNGYLYIDTSLNLIDEIELAFHMENQGYLLVDNLELNPTLSGVFDFNMVNYLTTGLGIAVRKYSPDSRYIYIYDPTQSESTRTVTSVPKHDYPSITANWSDDDYLTICELGINRLSLDMITITDARREGGGIVDYKQTKGWFVDTYPNGNIQSHEYDWYCGNGYYGGVDLPVPNLVFINIPETTFLTIKNKWINHYLNLLTDTDKTDMGIYEQTYARAETDFKFYLNQTIRKYISAGTDYLIVTPTISGTFDSSKIISLDL